MICANKQNNTRSATEQWADLAKVFKVMHSLQGKVSVSDVSTDLHLMKRKITLELQKLSDNNKLKLKPTKKNGIIDFVSSVPEMASKEVTRNNIIHGGIQNGIIDNKMYRYPDFDKMLATCRLDPTVEEYQL